MNLPNLSTNASTRETGRRILIVGASARAAAAAAVRAGWTPLAIDRFGDRDLDELCEQHRTYSLASEIPDLAAELPDADWLYTGPIENQLRLLRRLAEKRHLLGIDAETVKHVRDPWKLHACLRDAGLASPRVCRSSAELDAGRWLKKPRHSGGGCGIVEWGSGPLSSPVAPASRSARRKHYYQEFVAGSSLSAIFVAARRHAVLMGVTEQLIGPAWNAPKTYQYAGSVGPVVLSAAAETCLRRIGAAISERFELRGLFGVDFILAEDDSVWPVEVNPRYTASVEVLENAMQISLLSHHLEACLHERLPAVETGRPAIISGKLFLYARRTMVVGEATIKRITDHGDVVIADIPRPGTRLAAGDPICTVLLTAATVEEARRRLAESIAFAS